MQRTGNCAAPTASLIRERIQPWANARAATAWDSARIGLLPHDLLCLNSALQTLRSRPSSSDGGRSGPGDNECHKRLLFERLAIAASWQSTGGQATFADRLILPTNSLCGFDLLILLDENLSNDVLFGVVLDSLEAFFLVIVD